MGLKIGPDSTPPQIIPRWPGLVPTTSESPTKTLRSQVTPNPSDNTVDSVGLSANMDGVEILQKLDRIYTSKWGLVPEAHEFSGQKSCPPGWEISFSLARATYNLLSKLGNLKGVYVILELDSETLPLIGAELLTWGSEPYYVTPEPPTGNFLAALVKEAQAHQIARSNLNYPKSVATLFSSTQYNSDTAILLEDFPTPKQLRHLNMRRIIYIREKPSDHYPPTGFQTRAEEEERVEERLIRNFREAKFKLTCYEVSATNLN